MNEENRKMASQIDMFTSQPIEREENPMSLSGTPRVASTCPPKLNMWKWVVLFDRDESVPNPFLVHLVSLFGGEIKDSWLKSILSNQSRKKSITLSALDNKKVFLFGKIESSKFKNVFGASLNITNRITCMLVVLFSLYSQAALVHQGHSERRVCKSYPKI